MESHKLDSSPLSRFWRRFASVFLCVVVLAASARVFYALVTDYPSKRYTWRGTSTQSECNQLRQGMQLSEVLHLIEANAAPLEQRLEGDRFVFWRRDASCVVELDTISKKVKKSHVEVSPLYRWMVGSSE